MFVIYQRQRQIAVQLLVWGIASLLGGIVLLQLPAGVVTHRLHAVGRGVGLQGVIWGAIDLALALWGVLQVRHRRAAAPDEYREIRDTLRLRRFLVVNGRLDVLYIVIGLALAGIFHDQPFILGNGIGVVIQGLFLLVFDGWHAYRLPSSPPAWYDPAV